MAVREPDAAGPADPKGAQSPGDRPTVGARNGQTGAVEPGGKESISTLVRDLHQARDRLQDVSRQLAERTREIAEIHHQYRSSTSWRLTAPLRRVISMMRRRRAGGGLGATIGGAVKAAEIVQVELFGQKPEKALVADLKPITRQLMRERLAAFLGSTQRLRVPSGEAPDVSIVLVLFNQAELTFASLVSILECLERSERRAELVIVDNASSDETGELLDRVDGATIIRSPENLHFLRGVNLAVGKATGRHLLLLNNDAQLLFGSVEQAIALLDGDDSIGAVGGRIVLPDGTLQEAGSIIWSDGTCLGYGRGRPPTAPEAMFRRDVDYCSGAFLMTPRAVFERLGRFDEAYAPAYYEETDYCVRLWESGLRVVYDPAVAILHYEFGSAARPEEALARQRHNHELFRHVHRDWLAGQPKPGGNVHAARSARGPMKRVLFIEDRVPRPELGAGYPRANEIVGSLHRQGAEVTLFPMWRHAESWRDIRRCIPVEVEIVLEGEAAVLRSFLRDRKGCFDAILVSRPHNMRVLRSIFAEDPSLRGSATLVYDAEALFSHREVARAATLGTPMGQEEASELVRDEVALVAGADLVLSVSALEAKLFAEEGVGEVQLLGHAIRADPTQASFESRTDLLFLGAIRENNSPNADSVIWFVREVLPHIRAEMGPDTRLKVVGMVDAPEILAIEGTEIELLGRMEDLAPAFERARVVVVPTRFAAGIPHKAHHAAALGVPMVSTELIREQLGWRNGEDILAADDPRLFADRCVQLFRDRELWGTLRENALARIETECSPEAFDRSVASLLAMVEPGGSGEVPDNHEDDAPLLVQRAPDRDRAMRFPLPFARADPPEGSVGAVVHLFYAEQANEFRRYLQMLPQGSSVYISTDDPAKRDLIAKAFEGFTIGPVEVRLAPNRGRDIAPKLVTFRDVYDRHDFILHLHSKASVHTGALAPWRTYLLESLVGSREIVRSHLHVLGSANRVGMVFPQHFDGVRRWIDWGVNFSAAMSLAREFGATLDRRRPVDFPSGSMFWARSEALRPLLDLELPITRFPPEANQKDATIAHAIERLYAVVVEKAGYRWLKMARPEIAADRIGIVEVETPEDLETFVRDWTVEISGTVPIPVAAQIYEPRGIVPDALATAIVRRGPASDG